ncbi:galactokinase [Lachnoclostridium sp. Marseille-P6806]|uniref:galactokinase n=1 Tax=Lachnoclostridium sp. Marseille-P6806 TaxID=2364793 RepID=UPI00102F6F0A|nr:galactokinase family protein [Lachnoclostridium sp. Marseille-P6806]
MTLPSKEALGCIYGADAERAETRYENLAAAFEKQFGKAEPEFFTAPGRTEIIGNHTDHNGGRILAASISLDTIAAAAKTDGTVITIISEGYDRPIVVDTAKLDEVPKNQGSISLVGGIMTAAIRFGYRIGGFNAYVSTEVISAAGVSSSASFEMLVCSIVNFFFNDGVIDCAHYARMGQYAENHFWNKASGLMDQMACAAGGTILLDFSDGVQCKKVDFDFDQIGYDEVIINTGKGHADLSAEYSSIPLEMRSVAHELGADNLCGASEEALLAGLPAIRKKLGNDRAILRALHYFEECRRVDQAAAALTRGDAKQLLSIIEESGRSSWDWLQNVYCINDSSEQSIPLALALTQIFTGRIGKGVARIHGGGFAGVIMAVIPKEHTAEYVDFMTDFFGRENIYVMGIRQTGAVHVGR